MLPVRRLCVPLFVLIAGIALAVVVVWPSLSRATPTSPPAGPQCVLGGLPSNACTGASASCSGSVFLGGAGSATAPTYSWPGDRDTGIYNGEQDGIYFTSAGTLRWRIIGGALIGSAGDLTVAGGITSTAATVDVTSLSVASRSCVSLAGNAIGADCTAGIKQDATGRPVIRLNGNNIAAFAAAELTLSGGIVAAGAISGATRYSSTPQVVATGGVYTLDPTSSAIHLNPAAAATVTMGETGAVNGSWTCITNIHATSAATFSDTAGVSELAGAFVMSQYDVLCLTYVSDRWVETDRSDN